jgi:8-oxo-dGTP diphosphatase
MIDNMYLDVTAAVIIIGGKVLMATRPKGKHLAGYWEFPGGKVAPCESMCECIKREMCEELGVDITPLDILYKIEHHYSEKSVRITFFRAFPECYSDFKPFPHEKQKVDFFDFSELKELNIVPADKPLIEYLLKMVNEK